MKQVEKNWLEWIVFAASLVLVLSILGYLVYDVATVGEVPPNIEVQLGQPQPQSNHFLVPLSVTNRGGETAEGVHIEVTLENGSKEEESADFEIAFLPRNSTREGWVTFKTDPRTVEQMQARVLGFEKP
ncbi:hypothetical protein [Chroococcidiopsis sp. CCMEE 29]|uniref:hypothetical protein n=1 Tax=Chroococcidiopsis sp. CCMEE 29 TaxID=155894 RepID=UPI002020175E|nr:hypothetical protein [Chroococcidiopsis sp. CCMEE 29]